VGAQVAATPVALGELILIAAGHSLIAMEQDGTVAWEVELEGELLSTPAIEKDNVYVHSSTGLSAFDSRQKLLWHYPAEDLGALVDGRTWGWGDDLFSDPWAFYRSSPRVSGSAVVFGASDGIHAVDKNSGTRLWHYKIASVTTDIVGDDDTVVVADWNNRLRRFKVSDGSVQWTYVAPLPTAPFAAWIGWSGLNLTPLIADGKVFLGSRGTYFHAVDMEKGTELWSNKHGTSWIGSAAVAHGDQLYFGLSDGKALIGVDRNSANQTLFVPTSSPVFATPKVAGHHLIAGTLSGELLVVDLDQGRLEATHRLHDNSKPYTSYLQPDPESDLSPYQLTRHGLDLMKREQRSVLSVAVIKDRVLIGTGSGEVLAFDLSEFLKPR
jgi:outer membrane protein assembly factor BamB